MRISAKSAGLVAAGVVGGVLFASAPWADAQSRSGPPGRYQLVAAPAGGGIIFRLDTTTGDVIGCLTSSAVLPRVLCGATMAELRAAEGAR